MSQKEIKNSTFLNKTSSINQAPSSSITNNEITLKDTSNKDITKNNTLDSQDEISTVYNTSSSNTNDITNDDSTKHLNQLLELQEEIRKPISHLEYTDKLKQLTNQISQLNLNYELPKSNKFLFANHKFWDTMPVPKLAEIDDSDFHGPIDKIKQIEEIRDKPLSLPIRYYWDDIDIMNPDEAEEIYQLLWNHYVEDDDHLFRFNYSIPFIQWALTPPNYYKEWHVGVRVTESNKLVGFISGIPIKLKIHSNILQVAEINFLCIHKNLRLKRLTPVLIREITRRVNRKGIWQAVYTAGVIISKPLAICRYWHRTLNPKKLIQTGFTSLTKFMTLSRMCKLYRVNDEPKIKGIRKMEKKDLDQILELTSNYYNQFKLSPILSIDELVHWLFPKDDIINTYVVENDGKITDLIAFYILPSTSLKTDKVVKAAYSYLNIANTVSLIDLVNDGLYFAKHLDLDVYNILDLGQNEQVLKELKFGRGDGNLQYYLFNWKCPTIKSSDVSLILF